MKKERQMTNAEFAKRKAFIQACSEAGVKPTTRQTSKWRRKTGAAWMLRQSYKSE